MFAKPHGWSSLPQSATDRMTRRGGVGQPRRSHQSIWRPPVASRFQRWGGAWHDDEGRRADPS